MTGMGSQLIRESCILGCAKHTILSGRSQRLKPRTMCTRSEVYMSHTQ